MDGGTSIAYLIILNDRDNDGGKGTIKYLLTLCGREELLLLLKLRTNILMASSVKIESLIPYKTRHQSVVKN